MLNSPYVNRIQNRQSSVCSPYCRRPNASQKNQNSKIWNRIFLYPKGSCLRKMRRGATTTYTKKYPGKIFLRRILHAWAVSCARAPYKNLDVTSRPRTQEPIALREVKYHVPTYAYACVKLSTWTHERAQGNNKHSTTHTTTTSTNKQQQQQNKQKERNQHGTW